jgi:hypothetical protein
MYDRLVGQHDVVSCNNKIIEQQSQNNEKIIFI